MLDDESAPRRRRRPMRRTQRQRMASQQALRTGPIADDAFELPPDVPVSSFFIDESGSKNSAGGFFVVGFVKSRGTALLARQVRHVREKHRHYSEAKFGAINSFNKDFYFDLVEMLADADVRLGGSVYNSYSGFPPGTPTWEVQAKMSSRLVTANRNRGELLNVFVDLVQTPQGESVAKAVMDDTNGYLKNRAVIAAYDMDSQCHDLLQLADIVAGSIAYERRQWEGTAKDGPREATTPKSQVSARLRRALGLETFADVREGKVNILTMKAHFSGESTPMCTTEHAVRNN